MKLAETINAAEYRAEVQKAARARRGHVSEQRHDERAGRTAHTVPLSAGASFVEVELPIRIESALNLREGHWAARHRRARAHDETVSYSLIGSKEFRALVASGGPYLVTITRIAPRRLDDDNAVGGAKHVRDAVGAAAEDGRRRFADRVGVPAGTRERFRGARTDRTRINRIREGEVMTKNLKISKDLSLPVDVVTQTIGILAKRHVIAQPVLFLEDGR